MKKNSNNKIYFKPIIKEDIINIESPLLSSSIIKESTKVIIEEQSGKNEEDIFYTSWD